MMSTSTGWNFAAPISFSISGASANRHGARARSASVVYGATPVAP
jgi:hypothetical protein